MLRLLSRIIDYIQALRAKPIPEHMRRTRPQRQYSPCGADRLSDAEREQLAISAEPVAAVAGAAYETGDGTALAWPSVDTFLQRVDHESARAEGAAEPKVQGSTEPSAAPNTPPADEKVRRRQRKPRPACTCADVKRTDDGCADIICLVCKGVR